MDYAIHWIITTSIQLKCILTVKTLALSKIPHSKISSAPIAISYSKLKFWAPLSHLQFSRFPLNPVWLTPFALSISQFGFWAPLLHFQTAMQCILFASNSGPPSSQPLGIEPPGFFYKIPMKPSMKPSWNQAGNPGVDRPRLRCHLRAREYDK